MKIDHCAENVIINLDLAEGGTGGHFAEAHSNLVAINWGLPEFAELARNALDTPDSKTLPEPQD
ncbi:hypothetical protein DEJ47_04805 [Streptomyces venezuelae]|uniref:Uncharacterized protein n=2 Tax=Streptomyces venezuelae TaxID=54571 RepID=A0A5P2B5Z7_STRVZ|nr:hypothetical protein DEJ47_04805 [Streptomyces venezuelae]